MIPPPSQLTIRSFRDGLREKKFSALEITQAFFHAIKEKNKDINAYLSLREEAAIREAEAVDVMIAKGEDMGEIKGAPATAASKILENYIASYDAGVIKKLKAEHAVFLGKANLDEFAMGSSTENSAFGVTKNPHDTTRVAGGSSGGSVAAVAAHMALGGLGTETGGSIRQPAALCGVVGLKTTYGSVSRSGVISLAASLDQVGPIAKTVEDTAMLFKGIAGRDPLDATSADHDYSDLANPSFERIKKFTVGLPREYFIEGLDPIVEREVQNAITKIKSLGLNIKEISLPHTKYALSTYYIIVPAEASSNLARFDGVRYAATHDAKTLKAIYTKQRSSGFGPEAKRRIILGTFVLSSGYYDAYYQKAQKVRTLITRDFEEAFKDVDVLLTPATPTPAFKIGEKANNPLSMYLSDVFTMPANLAGVPALALPTKNSWGAGELPVGFQLIGKHWGEADILGLGQFFEQLEKTA